ncbi:MAG: M50 family metallopeptidase [Anaerolineales bacterium]
MIGAIGILIAIVAIGAMIFLHELGHFVAARMFGIEVEEFAIGMPSYKLATLFKWQGTEFTLYALPLGGFVRPKGENDPNVPGGLAAANPWKRIVVLLAGPFMNLVTALVIFTLLASSYGVSIPPVWIDDVTPNSPAEQAGLQPGDVIISIEGVEPENTSDASRIIREHIDEPITILIERNSETITLEATPLSARSAEEGALGVLLISETRPATFRETILMGAVETGARIALVAYLPVALIERAIDPEDAQFVSVIGIGKIVKEAFEYDVQQSQQPSSPTTEDANKYPDNIFWIIIGMLSISLGVMNLLPIPALDGGRILFTLPELIFRKRIKPEFENVVNGVVMMLLLAFMIFTMIRDLFTLDSIGLP